MKVWPASPCQAATRHQNDGPPEEDELLNAQLLLHGVRSPEGSLYSVLSGGLDMRYTGLGAGEGPARLKR